MRSLIVLVLMTAPALADTAKPKTAETMHTDDCARARAQHKQCVLNIDDEKVTGGVATATGTGVAVIQTTKQPSLVRPRQDFIVEIIRSAEDL